MSSNLRGQSPQTIENIYCARCANLCIKPTKRMTIAEATEHAISVHQMDPRGADIFINWCKIYSKENLVSSHVQSPGIFARPFHAARPSSKPAPKRKRKAKQSTGTLETLQNVNPSGDNLPGTGVLDMGINDQGMNRGVLTHNPVTNAVLNVIDEATKNNARLLQNGQRFSPMQEQLMTCSSLEEDLIRTTSQTASPLCMSSTGVNRSIATGGTDRATSPNGTSLGFDNTSDMSLEQRISLSQLQLAQLQKQLQEQRLMQQFQALQQKYQQFKADHQASAAIKAKAITTSSPASQVNGISKIALQIGTCETVAQQDSRDQYSLQAVAAFENSHLSPSLQISPQYASDINRADPRNNDIDFNLVVQQENDVADRTVGLGIPGLSKSSGAQAIELEHDTCQPSVETGYVASLGTYESFKQSSRGIGKASKVKSNQMRCSPYGNATQRQNFVQDSIENRVHRSCPTALRTRNLPSSDNSVGYKSCMTDDIVADDETQVSSAECYEGTDIFNESPVFDSNNGKLAAATTRSHSSEMLPSEFWPRVTDVKSRQAVHSSSIAPETSSQASIDAHYVEDAVNTESDQTSPHSCSSQVLQKKHQQIQQYNAKFDRPGEYHNMYGHYISMSYDLPRFSQHVEELIEKAIAEVKTERPKDMTSSLWKHPQQSETLIVETAYGEPIWPLGRSTIALHADHYRLIYEYHMKHRPVCTLPELVSSEVDRQLVEAIRRHATNLPIPEEDIVKQFKLIQTSDRGTRDAANTNAVISLKKPAEELSDLGWVVASVPTPACMYRDETLNYSDHRQEETEVDSMIESIFDMQRWLVDSDTPTDMVNREVDVSAETCIKARNYEAANDMNERYGSESKCVQGGRAIPKPLATHTADLYVDGEDLDVFEDGIDAAQLREVDTTIDCDDINRIFDKTFDPALVQTANVNSSRHLDNGNETDHDALDQELSRLLEAELADKEHIIGDQVNQCAIWNAGNSASFT